MKHNCPACGKRRFVRYIDVQTQEYLPGQYGRCDRETECAHHFSPYKDGYAKEQWNRGHGANSGNPRKSKRSKRMANPCAQKKPVYFAFDVFKETLHQNRYPRNVFIQNLLHRVPYPFTVEDVTRVVELYRLGTVVQGHMAGAVTFPFIDVQGHVRAIQIKSFDSKNYTKKTHWLHSILERYYTRNKQQWPQWLNDYKAQHKRVSCLFGAHLLPRYPQNPVALVEAPKTAIYGTLYFGIPEAPEDLIWLAVYSKSTFTFDKVKALQNRTVLVFPDLSKNGGTFREWQKKAHEFQQKMPGTRFILSDILERHATQEQKDNGDDIADILIKLDWREFRSKTSQISESCTHANSRLCLNEILPDPRTQMTNGDKTPVENQVCLISESPLSTLYEIVATIPVKEKLDQLKLRKRIAKKWNLAGIFEADLILEDLSRLGLILYNDEVVWRY